MKTTLKKLTHRPFFQKLSFFERVKALSLLSDKTQAQAQEIFNSLSIRHFDGCSFVDSTTCLAMKPSEEEIYQQFERLKEDVLSFFETLAPYYPNLHKITQEDSISYRKVIAAKIMVTFYDNMYFVSSVVLLRKNKDGSWQMLKKSNSSCNFFDEPEQTQTTQDYPKSIEISFCGGFGDVNYINQKDFKYHSDFFFAL